MRKNCKCRNKVASKQIAPPNYLIVCEGKQTEPNYFNGLREKINKKYPDRVKIIPGIKILGTGLNTEGIVNYTKKYINQSSKIYGQVWIVFDKDDFSDEQFDNAIKLNEYNSAWSNPNFELWILTHFKKVNKKLEKKDVMKEVQKEFKKSGLGEYKKNDSDIFKKLNENNRTQTAISNCKEMYKDVSNYIQESKKNPSTTVFMLVEDLSAYLE